MLRNFETVNKMFMAINDEDFTTMLPVLWLAAYRNTPYYWLKPKWSEIGASYDWTGAFNRLVDSVREGLRNEQGAVEYVLDQPAQEGSEEVSAGSPLKKDCSPASFDVDGETVGFSRAARRAIAKHSGR